MNLMSFTLLVLLSWVTCVAVLCRCGLCQAVECPLTNVCVQGGILPLATVDEQWLLLSWWVDMFVYTKSLFGSSIPATLSDQFHISYSSVLLVISFLQMLNCSFPWRSRCRFYDWTLFSPFPFLSCFPSNTHQFSTTSEEHFTFVLTDLDGIFRFGFCRYPAKGDTCSCFLR